MKHSLHTELPTIVTTYLEPLHNIPRTMAGLLELTGEKALAESAVAYFLTGDWWNDRTRVRLMDMYEKRGWNMFVWMYYRASRGYIGGYKALSACLKLKSI